VKHGIFSINVNGKLYSGKGEFTINPGVETNTAIMDTNGSVAGFSGEPKAPSIKGSITLDEVLDPITIAKISGATFTLDFIDGPTYILSNCSYTADGDLTTTEGEFQMEFTGSKLTKI